jgi:DNA-directed RNA polymerase specialized sigma24 family protein
MTAAELERLACEQRRLLLAIARRRARTHQDAEDAVQQALAIAFRHRERIAPQSALAYVGVIAQHEASRLRRQTERLRSLDEPLHADSPTSAHELIADDRTTDLDALIDARDALGQIKPDQARALMARALGWRYREICDAFAWTYTKTNRCLTEGRAALRERLGD